MAHSSGHLMSAEMQRCVEECQRCEATCIEVTHHCLALGGAHAEARHITVLLDCAQICGTAANFMQRGSELHTRVCAACADICRACERECRSMGDDDMMQRCADACRQCAESCERMAGADVH